MRQSQLIQPTDFESHDKLECKFVLTFSNIGYVFNLSFKNKTSDLWLSLLAKHVYFNFMQNLTLRCERQFELGVCNDSPCEFLSHYWKSYLAQS